MRLVLCFAAAFLVFFTVAAHADVDAAPDPGPSPSPNFPTRERPSLSGPHYVFVGSWVHRPDESSVEAQFAGLFPPLPEHAFELGPRIGALRALTGSRTRTDFSFGGESDLWILNFAAPGIAVDWMVTSLESDTHVRVEPLLTFRIAHMFNEGALALRIGLPYETSLEWGVRAGLTLQLDGVPRPGYGE